MNRPIDQRVALPDQGPGASADADRAATATQPSPEGVSGKAGIPCAELDAAHIAPLPDALLVKEIADQSVAAVGLPASAIIGGEEVRNIAWARCQMAARIAYVEGWNAGHEHIKELCAALDALLPERSGLPDRCIRQEVLNGRAILAKARGQ